MATDHDGHTTAAARCKPSCLAGTHQPDRALIEGRCHRCGGQLDGAMAARMLKARGIVRGQEAERGE